MTTYRAIGVAVNPTDQTTLVEPHLPLYEALVDIVEIIDVPASTKTIARETFQVVDLEDLAAQCAAHCAVLKARLEATQLAIDVPRKTLAEVTIEHTPEAQARMDADAVTAAKQDAAKGKK